MLVLLGAILLGAMGAIAKGQKIARLARRKARKGKKNRRYKIFVRNLKRVMLVIIEFLFTHIFKCNKIGIDLKIISWTTY